MPLLLVDLASTVLRCFPLVVGPRAGITGHTDKVAHLRPAIAVIDNGFISSRVPIGRFVGVTNHVVDMTIVQLDPGMTGAQNPGHYVGTVHKRKAIRSRLIEHDLKR